MRRLKKTKKQLYCDLGYTYDQVFFPASAMLFDAILIMYNMYFGRRIQLYGHTAAYFRGICGTFQHNVNKAQISTIDVKIQEQVTCLLYINWTSQGICVSLVPTG